MGYFIAPEVESLTTNSIKIQNINKQLTNSRVISLKGVPIRIEINSDKKWVEIKSYVDVNLDKYKEDLEKMKELFYSNCYIYAYYNEKTIQVYDIIINSNYLSYKDMNEIKKYGVDLPLAKTLFDGKLTKEILLDILKEEDISDIHILPSMYIEDPRISAKSNISKSNVIIGNKYNYGYNYNNGTYSYNYSHGYDDYDYDWWNKKNQQRQQQNKKQDKKQEKKQDKKQENDDTNKTLQVFKCSTKQERTDIYNETKKNVGNYIKNNYDFISQSSLDYYTKYENTIVYLYSIYTLPSTRSILFEYAFSNAKKIFPTLYQTVGMSNQEIWSSIIISMLKEKHGDKIKNKEIFKEFEFSEVFQEELSVLDMLYDETHKIKNFKDLIF